MKHYPKISWLLVLFLLAGFAFETAGCTSSAQGYTADAVYAEVVFEATLPQAAAENTTVQLEILDEISCLNFNPTRYEMSLKGETTYYVRIPLPINSIVKYRYILGTSPVTPEKDLDGNDIRYRMVSVNEPVVIQDIVAAWDVNSTESAKGVLTGFIVDATNNIPLPSVLVTIAGKQTYTATDGSFKIENVPVGEQMLLAYHPSGAYQVFQQKAVIANGAQTPAVFGMQPAQFVNATFHVDTPENTIKGAPLRLLGNLLQLGNTFSELNASCSVLASQAPIMSYQEDGSYILTVSLPVGLDIRYKYSLGDGFWNAERKKDGSFRVRQLVVPDHDIVITDTITTWLVGDEEPLTIRVRVPATTPSNESISLQLNPYVWMDPLPMWALGNNEWLLTIYSPLDVLANATYRYCRNEQCDASEGIIVSSGATTAIITSITGTISDEILQWSLTLPTTN
ncbi:MAG: peptidase associated/transthyretin-like domain-containing protein [Anaerolineaceae bacterium]